MSSVRKEVQLQGPRPAPLRVGGSSSKIKKPNHIHSRFPVIIHLISPKVIHVPPEEFMSLVQRLTGKDAHAEAKSFRPSTPPSNCCGPDRAAALDAETKGFDDDANFFGLSPTWVQFLTCS